MSFEDEDTLEIPIPVAPQTPSEPDFPEEAHPTTVNPLPPDLVLPTPVESADPDPVDPVHDRGRAGVALLAFAALLVGALLTYLFTSAAHETSTPPPVIETSTKTKTATATTTATATATRTKTQIRTPPPARVTITSGPTATRTITKTKTQKVQTKTTPRSCLSAIDTAEQYISVTKRLRGNRYGRGLLNRVEQEFRRQVRECRH